MFKRGHLRELAVSHPGFPPPHLPGRPLDAEGGSWEDSKQGYFFSCLFCLTSATGLSERGPPSRTGQPSMRSIWPGLPGFIQRRMTPAVVCREEDITLKYACLHQHELSALCPSWLHATEVRDACGCLQGGGRTDKQTCMMLASAVACVSGIVLLLSAFAVGS